MATTIENYNQKIFEHVADIDEVKLDNLLKSVTKFVKEYSSKEESKAKLYTKQSVVNEKAFDISEKIEKNTNSLSTSVISGFKEQTSNVQHQIQLLKAQNEISEKFNKENISIQQKLQSTMDAGLKEQQVQSSLQEISNNLAEREYRHSIKLQQQAEKAERVRHAEQLINISRDKIGFKLQSEYYKSMKDKVKLISDGWKELKSNPKGFLLDKLGVVLGKALDKTIDTMVKTMKAGLNAVVDGMSDLTNSIFDMMADQKRSAEAIAKEYNRDYIEASGVLGRANTTAASLAATGELNLSRTSEYINDIASKLLRDYGDDLKNLSESEFKNLFKLYAQAENTGIGNKIDELRTVFGEDTERFSKALEAEIQLAGIRSRQNIRIQKGMENAEILLDEAHSLHLTYEEAIEANKQSQLFYAKVLASNKDLGVDEAEKFVQLQKTLMSKDFVTNILDNQNIDLAQLIGLDANETKRRLSGSDSERLDVMNRIIKSGMYNTVPALKELMENLGFNAQSLSVLQKHGALKIDDNSIKKLTSSMNENFVDYNAKILSDGSLIQEEIKNRISLLSSEGLRTNGEYTKEGQLVKTQLRELNVFETLKREKGLSDEKDVENYRRIYKLLNEAGGDIDKLALTSEQDKIIAQELKEAYDKSDKTIDDQIKISETLSNAQDLGLSQSLKGGGLQGLFSGLLDVGLKSSYSETYQKKLSEFMGNLKEAIKPAVNVFKELLIDPIIDSIEDTIGKLLGNIYDAIVAWWKGDSYTEEESYVNTNKYSKSYKNASSRLNLASELLGGELTENEQKEKEKEYIKLFGKSINEESELFKKLLTNNDELQKLSFDDIDNLSKKGLSAQQIDTLKVKRATQSKALNSGGQFQGSNEVTDVVLNPYNRQLANTWLQNYSMNIVTGKKGVIANPPENILELIDYINESNNIDATLDYLSSDKDVNKDKLLAVFRTLKSNNFADTQRLYSLFGVHKIGVFRDQDLQAFLAYELVKGNLDLLADRNWYNSYNLDYHKEEYPNHVAEYIDGKYQKLATGGVVNAKSGGTKALLAEEGYDEIVLPTDPAKKERAQELLQIAKDKYNVFLSDPENVSEKLKEEFKSLIMDAKILMLQLDPLKDALASNLIRQTFNILQLFSSRQLRSRLLSNESSVEEVIGDAVPTKGSPVSDAPSILSLRNSIIERAKSFVGTPYAEYPKGLVCNELINAAYTSVLGAENYKELLNNAGYNHNIMHTISGFINEVGKNGFKGMLASHVSYSDLTGLAKPADLVFSANTGKTKSAYNPDNHGHVNLYIDSDSKIDSSSVIRDGKNGVGIHKPGTGYHMLINILDLMPESWYVQKGLMTDDGIIGWNVDGSPIYAEGFTPLNYSPALQTIPNASTVEDNVCRINNATVEKEKMKSEQQTKRTEMMLKRIIDSLKKLKFTPEETNQIMSMNMLPVSRGFSTSPSYTHNVCGFQNR